MYRILLLISLLLMNHLEASAVPAAALAAARSLNIAVSPSVLVVDVSSQTLSLYQDGQLSDSFVISSAKNGIGSREGSYCTPSGLHVIRKKIGTAQRAGSIFRARENTGAVWTANRHPEDNKKDLVLSRILWLEGLQKGKNSGRDSDGRSVDSFKRYIYIHGTNHENLIGTPASQGCIRMYNDEVIALYRRVPEGSLVWIQ